MYVCMYVSIFCVIVSLGLLMRVYFCRASFSFVGTNLIGDWLRRTSPKCPISESIGTYETFGLAQPVNWAKVKPSV